MESDPRNYPLELDLQRDRELRIRFADGQERRISLTELRKACPCATCRAQRDERQRNPLQVITPVADPQSQVTAAGAELCGTYALRLRWNDGHDTGIYDFGLLRRMGDEAAARPPVHER